jgi:hypothetical protein
VVAGGGVVAPATAGVGLFALDTSAGPSVTLAVNAVSIIAGSYSGMFVVNDGASGAAAFIAGGGGIVMLGASQASFSTAAGTASKINVYLDGSYRVCVENKQAASITFYVMMLRTLAAA